MNKLFHRIFVGFYWIMLISKLYFFEEKFLIGFLDCTIIQYFYWILHKKVFASVKLSVFNLNYFNQINENLF